jgi:type IV pilus assembly protein PilC
VLLVSGAVVWGVRWLLYTRSGQEWYERHALRLPVLGPLLKTFHAAYSVHLLALLCEILLPKVAVAELAHASLNAVFRERLEGVHQAMDDKAVKMSAAFLPHADLFGHDFQPTLATAEETRDFGGLERLGQVLDEELETQLTKFSKLMEPVTIICAGVGIFLVLIAMYLPLITLIGRLANRY